MKKKIEITYEITRRTYRIMEVSDEEYYSIKNGDVPYDIQMDLEQDIDTGDCDRDDNWAAVDYVTGKVLQDWR